MRRSIAVIGVPSSAGAFAPGQEQAPAALRAAGLIARLQAAGIGVTDHGDSAVWRWRPDRQRPRAQNLEAVIAQAAVTARRVGEAVAAGEIPLVLGGDCTIELGTVAGFLFLPNAARIGLLYFDLHADLNVPDSEPEGAAAHALAAFAGYDALLVHFDVDVIDFTDAPLSENTGRNEGLILDQAFRALRILTASPIFSALTITELNPLHGEEDGATLERFVGGLVETLAASPVLGGSSSREH